jgi:hypothetical protein
MVPLPESRGSNMNDIRELNDAELEAVTGGMSCNTALAMAKVYRSFGDTLGILGDYHGELAFNAMGLGVASGGCD